jgi:hypothetical protein
MQVDAQNLVKFVNENNFQMTDHQDGKKYSGEYRGTGLIILVSTKNNDTYVSLQHGNRSEFRNLMSELRFKGQILEQKDTQLSGQSYYSTNIGELEKVLERILISISVNQTLSTLVLSEVQLYLSVLGIVQKYRYVNEDINMLFDKLKIYKFNDCELVSREILLILTSFIVKNTLRVVSPELDSFLKEIEKHLLNIADDLYEESVYFYLTPILKNIQTYRQNILC